ncbi:glycosyl hydrolase family 95 catalytic domain-containing protein, partial [Klebsiella pneumoniae]|uniref:glycosyl hydrolase family 95 catalytic domain-containing protein n=2 Tax=Bacteria TaxID=2 RepID=UPI001D0E7B21
PLFAMLEDLSHTGRRAARILYGARGWTTHHNVDIWRQSTPTGGDASWAFWPMGGVWMTAHLWERYS